MVSLPGADGTAHRPVAHPVYPPQVQQDPSVHETRNAPATLAGAEQRERGAGSAHVRLCDGEIGNDPVVLYVERQESGFISDCRGRDQRIEQAQPM